MSAIVLNDLAAATITYNGVQFGGADSDYKSVPPTYKFSGRFVYDRSGRTIIRVEYTLIVSATFYEASEAALANNVALIKRKLSKVGQQLTIIGLGTAFDTVSNDPKWGPLPQDFQWQPIGNRSWEMIWVVKFSVVECRHAIAYSWLSFNFETTWVNNFEGMCTRTIAGMVEIASQRSADGRTPLTTADAHRTGINVAVPTGFERISNVWHLNDDATGLSFNITDQQKPGTEALPQGIIKGSGFRSFESKGPGFSEGTVSISGTLRVSPSFAPGLGGVIAMSIAANKQREMIAANPGGTVLPRSMRLSNGMFDDNRTTSFAFSWLITKCLPKMMDAAGIWKPVTNDPTHRLWQASVKNLWENRGIAGLTDNPNDHVIIDLCSNVSSITIGTDARTQGNQSNPQFTFSCPDIPEDGGWIAHDLHVSVRRRDYSSTHRKAIPYLPSFVTATIMNALRGTRIPLGGSPYDMGQFLSGTKAHDIEYHGNPEVEVLLQFRGLRLMREPQVPELKTVAGIPVVSHDQYVPAPSLAFEAPCPVWFVSGWRLYRVNGYVPDILATESKVACIANNGDNQNQ